MNLDFIKKYIALSEIYMEEILIVLVMNVQGVTKNGDDYSGNSIVSEYYSYKQYQDMQNAILDAGFDLKCYFDELDFISDFSMGLLRDNYPKKIFVLNSAQRGTFVGRKSLIPSFCDMNNISYIGNNPYAVSFFRNKYHWYAFLNQGGFPVCKSYSYYHKKGWLFDKKPFENERLIIKLNNESSSIGLSSDNIVYYNNDADKIVDSISKKYNQAVILEQFISGYEVETPVLISKNEIFCFPPAGISVNNNRILGDQILDYNVRGNHLFQHYEFKDTNPGLAQKIIKTTKEIVKNTDLQDYARIDYRIDTSGNYFITDIATNPHITKSMTFYYYYEKMKLNYSDLLRTLIGLALERTDLTKKCNH